MKQQDPTGRTIDIHSSHLDIGKTIKYQTNS